MDAMDKEEAFRGTAIAAAETMFMAHHHGEWSGGKCGWALRRSWETQADATLPSPTLALRMT